jgi:serine/threonine-protein kinase
VSLTAGTQIGPYEVVGHIGAGGMGEVYRARDTRLKRDVALKVLPAAAVSDPDRRSRFEREALVLASLNHPAVAQIFGVEPHGGSFVIVMELVEGVTLAERLASGPLPLDEALPIARQICDGLEAAHERGIIHRDLKPANIKLRPDATIKVLDFGLARALTDESAIDAASSPTVLGARTEMGIILGTAAYMSPEQARGRTVDRRADIWAFGCVLFEMLTGTQAFAGESTTDILAAVVQQEPDWSRVPAHVPARVTELLRRCLQKQPKDRLRDIGDARFELDQAGAALRDRSSQVSTIAPPPATASARAGGAAVRAAWFAAGALVAAALLQLPQFKPSTQDIQAPPLRLTVALPPDTTVALGRGSSVALSPDGRDVVYAGRVGERVQLYRRRLDGFDSHAIPGTDNASHPFFSPDGRWVGFFADGRVRKVSLDGGAPVVVTEARTPRGEAWGADDTIYVSPSNNVGIGRVSAQGGTLEPVTTLLEGELSHRWPRLLPGGSVLLFTLWNDTGWEPSRILAQRLASGERTTVVERGGGYPRYLRDGREGRGYLIYARSEGLMAAPFDEATLSLTGQAVPIVDEVITNLSGGAHFDISPTGTLAYLPGTIAESDRDLAWVTLDGNLEIVRRVPRMGRYFTLSPDATRVLRSNTIGDRDIWVEHLTSNTSTRLTSSTDNFNPIWSKDGRWAVFTRGAPIGNLYRRRIDQSGFDERLTTSLHDHVPNSVSPDGVWLTYVENHPGTSTDIWVMRFPGDGRAGEPGPAPAEARPFLQTRSSEGSSVFSPDGRWLAYQSNETGRFEIYVRSFPDGAQMLQVSTEGGIEPQWSPRGDTLFFRGTNGQMMGAAVTTTPAFRLDTPRRLFDATGYENFFGVSADGRRLLMMPLINTERSATQIRLIVNFLSELRQRVR